MAYAALLVWLPLSFVFAGLVRSPQQAFLWIYFGGALLLPEKMSIAIPAAPPIDKHAVAALGAWLSLIVFGRGVPTALPKQRGSRILATWLIVSSIATWLNNRDTLVYGPLVLPGHGLREAIWASSVALLDVVLPFYLGQRLFKTTDELKILLRGFAIAGLLYTPLVLAEARIAPFLHQKVYGYFQHDWAQALRGDGFRAFVFMSHGLSVAFFISQALIAINAFRKTVRPNFPISLRFGSWILAGALISCKSLASTLYAIVAVLLIQFTSAKAQIRFACILSVAVVLYPIARFYDRIPTDWIVEQARGVSEDRAGSILFRFMNEDILLEKALERSWFGWGWWARNRVYNAAGSDTSVTDGEWIIHLGQGGVLRFIIIFSMLLIPIWKARNVVFKCPELDNKIVFSTFALMSAIQGLDLIPNATSNTFGFLIAGALGATCNTVMYQRKRELRSRTI